MPSPRLAGHPGAEHRAAADHEVDGRVELLGLGVLGHVAPSPRGDGAEERVAILAGAEHDDFDVVAARGQAARDLETVHARHGDVEEQHAAGVLGDARQSLVAARGIAGDDVALALKQLPQPLPEEAVVVGDDHASLITHVDPTRRETRSR